MSGELQGQDLWVVIVNWNGGDHNLRCLAATEAAGIPAARTVMVDNGSKDGSLERVIEGFGELAVIRNASNLGFGEAANQGAAHALDRGARVLLLLNNDLELDPQAVGPLLDELNAHRQTGACGPRLLMPGDPKRIWAAGGRIDHRQNISMLLGSGQADGPPWTERRKVDYVVGAALCIRAEAWRACGGLRADYFAYMEDVEFGLRIGRAGWDSVSVGGVQAVHHPSSSTGGGYNPRRKYMQAVNSVRFLREYGDRRAWLRFWCFDVLTLPPALFAGLFRGRARAVAAKALGLWHGLRGRRVEAQRLESGAGWLW